MKFTSRNSNLFRISVIALICVCKINSEFISPSFKLPAAIFPTKYQLHISTNIHQDVLAYNGSVAIDLTIREATKMIVLNAKELQQFNITLTNIESGLTLERPQLQFKLDEVKEQLLISWPFYPLKLQIGQQYRLTIGFVGNIQENETFGLFKSTYLDEKNNSIPIATTQFEPTSARLAFPCFDEPAFKAKFTISITHGKNYSAISNMPVDGEPVTSGQMTTTTFLETPTMSSYLIALAITNYDNTSILVNGLEHRSFFPPNSKDNGSRALENAIKTVAALEKHLGIKYLLPKLDHIQIGKSYGLAMENWGLMVFVNTGIISNEKVYNKLDLLHVINIQNHEIAHQWFGNLVTHKSWSYTWLKEGLSTYFSYVAANLVYPEKRIFEYFITSEVFYVYSMSISHPLTNVIKEGVDIKRNMDVVAYKLGASVVRMFDHAIGQRTFLKGITKYLLIFQYSVADEDDLFGALQAAVDEDEVHLFQKNQSVADIMRTWTHNHGVPIVTIIRNYDSGTITIRQKSNSAHVDEKWWIPMNFATATNPDFERTVADFIMPPQAEVTLDLKDLNISLSNSDWLIVNKQQTAIYYVVYDDLNLKMIGEALNSNHNGIHVFNRALIFRDLSVTFDKELDSIEPVLEILQYLHFEEESLPLFNAVDLIIELISRLEGSSVSEKFKSFIYNLLFVGFIDQKYQNSSENLTATDLRMKEDVLKLYYVVDKVTCQNYGSDFPKEYFSSEFDKIKRPCLPSLCQGIKNATLQELGEFFRRLIQLNSESAEFDQLKHALRCVESEEHMNFVYGLIFDKDSQHKASKMLIFVEFLKSNAFFRDSFSRLNYAKMNTQELKDFFESIDEEQNLKIKKREEFLWKYEKNLNTWLENLRKI